MTSSASEPVGPVAQGIAAARATVIPGAILWTLGLAVVLSYYLWPAATDVFRKIGEWKVAGGYLFAAVSTGFFAGVLPFLFRRWQKGMRSGSGWTDLVFSGLFWAFRGVEVDALYRLQAHMFGDDIALGVVAPKVLVDQFVYCPLWAIPLTVILYFWKDCGFQVARMKANLGGRWYYRRVVPVMVSNWAVWIPAVALIYFLPQPLQLPLQNIVACFWVLLLMYLTGRNESVEDVRQEADPSVPREV